MAAIGAVAEAPRTRGGSRRGEALWRTAVALSGTNPTTVTTPLVSVGQAQLTIGGSATPGTGTSVLTYVIPTALNTIAVYAWKPSAVGTSTLVASDGTETIHVLAYGKL